MAGRKTRKITVRVIRQAHALDLPLPAYHSEEAAGVDLVAAIPAGKTIRLKPGKFCAVPTGLIVELPKGFEAQVRPRSGLAARSGITVLNSPGTIDSDYRGEISVLLINLGGKGVSIRRGDRIAQLVLAPVVQVTLEEATAPSATRRGARGFGSTGVRSESKRQAAPPRRRTVPRPGRVASISPPRQRPIRPTKP